MLGFTTHAGAVRGGFEAKKKVLVTGMSGLIGSVVRKHLGDSYEFTALNRREVAGVRTFRADISDFSAMRPAFDGQETVVHLAAFAIANSYMAWEDVLKANIIGTRNVFEASRQAGVKRVIFGSSGSVMSDYEKDFPYSALVSGDFDVIPPTWPKITHLSPVRPGSDYGSSKAYGEAAARQYVDSSDLSIICLRIGRVNPENRPTSTKEFTIWCSHRDIARMIELCIEAPEELRFDIFFVLSDNKWTFRDITHARDVLGYVSQDKAEDYCERGTPRE